MAATLLALGLGALPSHAQFFHAVHSRDALDVIAVGDSGAIYRSLDGGIQWSKSTLGTAPLRDVVAWDWNIVVVGDGGKVWRSTNLGQTWSETTVSGSPQLRRGRCRTRHRASAWCASASTGARRRT